MAKRIGIVGAGNVGSALVMALAGDDDLKFSVAAAARDVAKAEAAILDAAGAYPEVAASFLACQKLEGSFDLVIVTAGVQPHGELSLDELLQQNAQIAIETLSGVDCKTAIVIGTPVDRLTEKLSRSSDFAGRQVIGFGGQLDVARTEYALNKRNISHSGPVYVIGEHGPRAIPVYAGEERYDEVRQDASSVLKHISTATGKARNLATGIQLARLVKALTGEEQVLCISAPDKEHCGMSITWPYVINSNGLVEKVEPLEIGTVAEKLLRELLEKRRQESLL